MNRVRASKSNTTAWYNSSTMFLNRVSPSLVHDYVNNRYYNTADGETSFPFTATRTSNATMFDSQGRLVWAPANLFLNSASLGTQSVTVVNGAPYTVSFWGTGSITLSGGASGTLNGVDANTRVSTSFTASSTSVTFTVSGTVTNAQLELTSPDSPKSYNITTGSAYYGPRLDYNPNGNAALGLLVEEARTNLNPNHLTVASVTQGSQATGNNMFGTPSVRVTYDGTSNVHNIAYSTLASAPAASTVHTVSAYVRRISGANLIQLTVSSNYYTAATDYVNFDISNGTVVGSGVTVVDSAILNCGNSIYRISMSFTTGAAPAAGASCLLAAITAAGDTRLPTNTSSDVFECFGAQLESGRGVSSLIPTYGAAATRNADNFTTTPVSWLDQTKGTWYASVVPHNALATARRAVSISDGTANNAYSMLRSTGRALQPRTALSGVADFTPTTANTSSDFASAKMALLLNSPTKKTVLNGGTVASASVAFPTSGYTTLTVGADAGAYAYWQGWIKELRYYADASASDGQLQTLTT